MTSSTEQPDLVGAVQRNAESIPRRPALIDDARGLILNYSEVATFLATPSDVAGLVFLFMRESTAHVLAYLWTLAQADAVALIHPRTPPRQFARLLAAYRPDAVIGEAADLTPHGLPSAPWRLTSGELVVSRPSGEHADGGPALPDQLQLLLSTSGSTGSPKFVRLSKTNVVSNATAIAEALDIQSDDVGVTCLPLHYTYGLSILHSHLVAGASVLCTDADLLSESFWKTFEDAGCTSLAGVPLSYSIYDRLRLLDRLPPSLRSMTQAGGKLDQASVSRYANTLAESGRRFYVMYGQTEATARMSVLPPDLAPVRPETVGFAIAGGRFEIDTDSGREGEVVYFGPNVMLGYARERADLHRGDELNGCLRTGDLGYLTGEGLLRITGRLKRIVKVNGVRVSLDDVEAYARESVPAAAVGTDDKILLFVAGDVVDERALRRTVAKDSGVAPRDIEVILVNELPVKDSGKIDYRSLEAAR